MNVPTIISILVPIIVISSILIFYVFASIQSRTRHEPTFLKDEFTEREKQKGISAAYSIFGILLLFLTVVVLMGM